MSGKRRDDLHAAVHAHLHGWQKTSENIKAQLVQLGTPNSAIARSILEAQEGLRQALEPLITQPEKLWEHLAAGGILTLSLPHLPEVVKRAADLQRSVTEALAPGFSRLADTFKTLPPRTRKAVLILGQNGWYLDMEMDMPWLWWLEDAFAKGNGAEAEALLIDHFDGRAAVIEECIVRKFPSRERIIRAAFKAHRNGDYELSIPVFLAQTDGICKEAAGHYFFMKKDKRPHTALYVDQCTADSFTAALLSPLAAVLPIALSDRERGNDFSSLNRHMVMHGESSDYGTRPNSLRAISLINYVSQVLSRDNFKYDDGEELE